MSTADIASWHPGTVMQDFSLRAFATAARRRSAADIGMWQIDDFENQIILTPRHIMEPGLMASSPMINIWHGHHWSTNKTWPLVSSNLLNRLKQIHGGLSLIPWTSLHWFWVSMLLIANTFTARRLPWQRESWQRTPAKATNLCVGQGYTNHLAHQFGRLCMMCDTATTTIHQIQEKPYKTHHTKLPVPNHYSLSSLNPTFSPSPRVEFTQNHLKSRLLTERSNNCDVGKEENGKAAIHIVCNLSKL